MVECAEREPTLEEIVVALRETRQGAGRASPFTVVEGQPGDKATDVAVSDLRDGEIERLLSENARLNERVVFLLKVIEREELRHSERAVEHAPVGIDRGVIAREVKAALEAQLHPVLLVLLRLVEKRHAGPAEDGGKLHPGREPVPSEWIVDLIRKLDSEGHASAPEQMGASPPGSNLRQRMARVRDALRS